MLIGVQVASSCVLLILAGLLGRAFDRARSADLGFEYTQVVVIEPSLAEHGYTAARAHDYIHDLEERLRAVAGIEAVSITSTPPLGDRIITALLHAGGRPFEAYIYQVDPHYLATMKIPLVRGRNLGDRDDRSVVVSESLARRMWPDRDALGELLTIGGEPLTVVGIAGNARSLAIQDPEAVELYRVARGNDFTDLAVVARTAGPSGTWVAAIAAAANGVDRNLTPQIHLLKDTYDENVGGLRSGALAVSALGVIALSVACLGVVGLVAYSVAARTKEIGIRLALGARPRHILKSLSARFLRPVAGGLLAGVLGAAGLVQLLRRELYGVSTLDPIAYLAAVGLFVLVVGVAALWPAMGALRVDPLATLRCD